jgi:hypothetical protein
MKYHLKREHGKITEALPADPADNLKTWDCSLNLTDALVFSASMLAVLVFILSLGE